MSVIEHAAQAAAAKSWPAQQSPNGDVRVEVPTEGGRTHVVTITMSTDGDGDAAAFIWSKAADRAGVRDAWPLLQLNASLTYGRVALRGDEIVILHALYDATADLAEVGKAIYWVARAADDLEKQTYGTHTDVL